jgi:hypothetical protein
MSNNNFVKGECPHCSGHLEFPADAAGETVECPHCHQPTSLIALGSPNKNGNPRRGRWIVVFAVLAVAAMAVALWLGKKAGPAGGPVTATVPVVSSNPPTIVVVKPVAHKVPNARAVTNDFAIMPFKLEKTPGSSLVYVTGTLRNLSDRQRFGVKIEFGLTDDKGGAAGTATDYESEIDPHSAWRFKALVMESKAVSARFNSVLEDK